MDVTGLHLEPTSGSMLRDSSRLDMETNRQYKPFDQLPEALLDRIVSEAIQVDPLIKTTLLYQLGSALHSATSRVIFNTIILQDDDGILSSDKLFESPLSAVLINPSRYGSFVRRLDVVNSSHIYMDTPPSLLLDMDEDAKKDMDLLSSIRPLSAQHLEDVLGNVPSLETFVWRSAYCPPDGICEILNSYNPLLTSFNYLPAINLSPHERLAQAKSAVRWDALSLPMLSTLGLTSLHLSRLSHDGVRSLANLLSLMDEETLLEDVLIDTNWLDEHLCQLLGNACRKAKRLEVGSDGTRFNDKCIVALFSQCDHLEQFTLGDVQGRLSKSLWEKIQEYPSSLRRICIRITEHTLQHSWPIEHLASLNQLPMDILTHLSIIRQYNPHKTQVSDAAALTLVPANIVHSLQSAKQLRLFECDWWSWRSEDLKTLLENCPSLHSLRVAFDGPFTKFLSMAPVFSIATNLERLAVFIPEEHCPMIPPSPPVSTHRIPSRSPAASPVQRNRALSTSLNGPESPNEERNISQSNFDTVPLRDIKKLARRCPSLRDIIWYGKHRIRKQWVVIRNLSMPQSTSNPAVEVIYPHEPLEALWDGVHIERDSFKVDWLSETVEREGALWTGDNADHYATLRALEKEKEGQITKQEKSSRGASKKSCPPPLEVEVSFPKISTNSNTVSPVDEPSEIPTPISPNELRRTLPSRKPPPRSKRQVNGSSDLKPSSNSNRSSSYSPERRRAQSHNSHGGPPGASTNNNRTRASDRRGSTGADSSVPGYRRASQPGQSTHPSTTNSSSRGRGLPRRSLV